MCLKLYEVDPVHFFSVPGLAWQEALKKIKMELDLSTDFNILTMVEKINRCRICHAIY